MTIQEKMSSAVSKVLLDPLYQVKIINSQHYKVFHNTDEVFDTRTTLDIMSHWRSHVRNIIAQVIYERINKTLNEL
ncbi:MAG TPA: hypothetical protein VHL77_00675 [Ferruginibacter sp.]|jgi:hypothetical protein|nr:hypothetical protein [Ferruginibacter sp.]